MHFTLCIRKWWHGWLLGNQICIPNKELFNLLIRINYHDCKQLSLWLRGLVIPMDETSLIWGVMSLPPSPLCFASTAVKCYPFNQSWLLCLAWDLLRRLLRGTLFRGRQLFSPSSYWRELYIGKIIINCLHIRTQHMGTRLMKIRFYVVACFDLHLQTRSFPLPAAAMHLFSSEGSQVTPSTFRSLLQFPH